MRINISSLDVLLVSASVAAIVISVGLVERTLESGGSQPSAGGLTGTEQQHLPLLVVAAGNAARRTWPSAEPPLTLPAVP